MSSDDPLTRRAILVAATEKFAAESFSRVTLRAVAKRAGVGLGTIHHYFSSKQELYDACFDDFLTEVHRVQEEMIKEAKESGESPAQIFERAVRVWFRFLCERRPVLRLSLKPLIETGRRDRRAQAELRLLKQAELLVTGILGVSGSDARLLVQTLVHMLGRYALVDPVHLAAVVDVDDPKKAEDEVCEFLVRACRILVQGIRAEAQDKPVQ